MTLTKKETSYVLEKPEMVVTAPAGCKTKTADENPYFVMEAEDGAWQISVYMEETAESAEMKDLQLLPEEKRERLINEKSKEKGAVTFSGSVKADYLIWEEDGKDVWYTCKNGKDIGILMTGNGNIEQFITAVEYRHIPRNPMSHLTGLPRQIPFILGGIMLGALVGILIMKLRRRK